MILEICAAGEVEQELEYFCSPLTAKRGKNLLLADKRPGMACEDFWIETHACSGSIEVVGKLSNVNGLIVEYKPHNVIARGRIGVTKGPRFIYEYA